MPCESFLCSAGHWWRHVHLSEKSHSLLSVTANAKHGHLKPGIDTFTIRLRIEFVSVAIIRFQALKRKRTSEPSNVLSNCVSITTTVGAREENEGDGSEGDGREGVRREGDGSAS